MTEGTIERADGRAVSWARFGPATGRPLLRLHGTPGSRLDRSPDPGLYDRIDAQVVTFDRPGYGSSSAQRERTLLSVAADAIAVVDELGWDRFAVLGVSGGGPHALALCVHAPERLGAVGLAVGATPADLIEPDDLIAVNRESRARALEGRASLEAYLAGPAAQIAGDPIGAITAVMADAPAADRELFERRSDLQALVAESLREAFANGPQGWFDDSWALSQPWGFELEQVTLPVYLWYCELDRNVPLAAARRLAARLAVAGFEVIPGAGHLGWLSEEERILRTILDAASA